MQIRQMGPSVKFTNHPQQTKSNESPEAKKTE
jgi:hypothetical protein